MDENITAENISWRFSGIQHTIRGRDGKELEDDLFEDVDPMNYEVWSGAPDWSVYLALFYRFWLSSYFVVT